MTTEESSSRRLQDLLDELGHIRGGSNARVECYTRCIEQSRAEMYDLPLVHGTRLDVLETLFAGDRTLRSRAALGKGCLEHQETFGTHGAVYLALGVLYPRREIAIVLSPHCEADTGAEASPWDSGRFFKLCKNGSLPDVDARDAFRRYSLGAPDYRRYAVEYVASCYELPRHYVESKPPVACDPVGVFGVAVSDPVLRSFEVRFPERVAVSGPALLAVFLPRDHRRRILHEVVPSLEAEGVHVEFVAPMNGRPGDLRAAVERWISVRCSLARERRIG